MKKIFLALLFLVSSNLYAQDWNDDEHERKHKKEKFKKDYFTIGLYTGNYDGEVPLTSANNFANNVTVEFEYFKFKDFSVLARYSYCFTKLRLYDLKGYDETATRKFNEPHTSRINVSLMGRYYLASKKVRPYIQLGINHEHTNIGDYSITHSNPFNPSDILVDSYHAFGFSRYTMNLGAGITIKLWDRILLDMKYDIYKALSKNYGNEDFYSTNSTPKSGFNGFSSLIGIKYNF